MANRRSSKSAGAKKAKTKSRKPVKKAAAKRASKPKASTKVRALSTRKAKAAVKTRATAKTLSAKLEVKQNSDYRGNDWWDWSIWIEGPDKLLDEVDYVEYKLHPTFPDPIQRRSNRQGKFALESSGWGEFMIDVEIRKHDGSKTKTKHWLTLAYSTPSVRSATDDAPQRESTQSRSRVPQYVSSEKKSKSAVSFAAKKEGPTVFLSTSISDLAISNAIGEALKQRGLKVLRADNSTTTLPWDVCIARFLDKTDLVTVLISGGLTTWARREIDAAVARKLPILPIVIGTGSPLPEPISELQAINLKDAQSPDKIAPKVADQIVEAIAKLGQRK